MRLLFYTPFINRGGVRRMAETLASELHKTSAQRGWTIEILGQEFDENGEKIDYPPIPFTQINPGPTMPKHPKLFEYLVENSHVFVNHLASVADNYDCIFCPNAFWSMWGEWTISTPFVTLIPDFAWDFINMGTFLKSYFWETSWRIGERAACTIFIGDYHRLHAESEYGFKRTKTINNSADLFASVYTEGQAGIERIRAKYALPESYILLPHAMHHHGMANGIQGYGIAKKISKDIPPLVISGIGTESLLQPNDSYSYSIRKLIEEKKLGDDIYVLGKIRYENMGALFAGASLTLVPSMMDGDLSGSLMQAIQSKSPLVYSQIPVFKDRLGDDDRYGLSFDPDSYLELGMCIRRGIEKPDEARERAERVFEWAQRYTLKDVVSEYWAVIESVKRNQ